MITLEMLNHLATWVLNTDDEQFKPIKGKLPVQLTEVGLNQLQTLWFRMDDASYSFEIQKFKDVLEKMLSESDTTETLDVVDQPEMCDLISLIALAFRRTFDTYSSRHEFYEFVKLESYDFDYLAQHHFYVNDLSLNNFKLNFDELQNELDRFIEFKGYEFVEDQFRPFLKSHA